MKTLSDFSSFCDQFRVCFVSVLFVEILGGVQSGITADINSVFNIFVAGPTQPVSVCAHMHSSGCDNPHGNRG